MQTSFIFCVAILVIAAVSGKPASDLNEEGTLVERVVSLEKRVDNIENRLKPYPKEKEFVLKSKFQGQEVTEDVTVDEEDKTETDVITMDDREHIIHHDFERRLTVIIFPEQAKCFLKELDPSMEKDGFEKEEENLEVTSSHQGDARPSNETITRVELRATEREVVREDLGEKILDMCDGFNIKWAEQIEVEANEDGEGHRQKRGCRWRCYLRCSWGCRWYCGFRCTWGR